jgi:hypothetical protein
MPSIPQPCPDYDDGTPGGAPPVAPVSPLDLILHVYGPKRAEDSPVALWDGMVNVHRMTDPNGKPLWDYRQVFVAREPLSANILLPGTIVVQASVQYVDTRIGIAPASRWVPGPGSADQLVTLLLDCPPGDWVISGGTIVQSPRCRCVAGEIRLGDFAQQPPVDEWQRHFRKVLTFPKVLTPDSFAVNSSGFALVAQATLPWQEPVRSPSGDLVQPPPLPLARYQVVIPRPSTPPTLVMELDRERLHVDHGDTEAAYTAAFSDLAALLRPGENDPARCLNWAGFDLDLGGGIPSFLWQIEPKPAGGGDAAIDLRLAEGVVRLTLADQRLGDPLVSPRTIATCSGAAVVRSSGLGSFDLNFQAERPIAIPLDGTVVLPDTLGGRLVETDGQPRLLWSGGRSLHPADLKALSDLAAAPQSAGPLAVALAELIGSCTLKPPFAASVSGHLPDLSAEPDLKDLLAFDDPKAPTTTMRWVVPWISPEAEARMTSFSNDVQWDASFRRGLKQLIDTVTALPKFEYQATPQPPGFAESIDWSAVDLVYDALGAADVARNRTGTPAPDLLATTPVAKGAPPSDPLFTDVPFVLWGPAPTDDGWAELPFFNLTEDVYLRVLEPPGADLDPPLISGAATFGTTTAELSVLAEFAGEQKWDVTLLDADVITAHCGFTFDESGSRWGLTSLEARFWGPELLMSGWLWLSNVSPSVEDSIPDFSSWLTALSTLDLRSPRRRELFPCPFLVRFERGGFTRSLPPNDSAPTFAYPIAGGWTYQYRDNDRPIGPEPGARSVFETLLTNLAPFLPDGKPPALPPLLWRRHPSLPAIQTLPLTQSRTPPNYPSPSRQLAPFVLPIEASTFKPGTWRFDVSPANGKSGAAAWPTLLDPKQAAGAFDKIDVAAEWQAEPVVGMAYLSLPGLAGYPAMPNVPGVVADPFLPLALAHGLPANDEIHALAELPKAAPEEPDSQAAEAPVPVILTRETYAARWADLAERAYRAAADGEPAITTDSAGRLAARALIEPYPWNLSSAALEDAGYPGRFELHAAASGSIGLSLTRDAALAGFDGWFRVNAGALERFDPTALTGADQAAFLRARGTSSAIAVVGGAMAAVGDGTSLRDQRGLVRFATIASAIVPGEGSADSPWRVLRTGASLETAPGTFLDRTLVTSLGAVSLSLDGFGAWTFWFRDLPLNGKPNAATTYSRSDTGDALFREDVNDPTALGRNYGFRAGYEWRLFDPGATHGVPQLGFLFCHPLTLETLTFDADATGKPLDTVKSLEVVVRLQLPLSDDPIEQVQSSNAARLVFDRRAGQGLRLEEIHIAASNTSGSNVPRELIWPLSDAPGAPRLRMVDRGAGNPGVAYQAATGGAPATLTIRQPTVDFPVLETIWSPRLSDTLTIVPGSTGGTINWKAGPSDAATFVESVSVTINGTVAASSGGSQSSHSSSPHALALTVVNRWGRRPSGSEPAPPVGVMLRQTVQLLGKVSNPPGPQAFLGDDTTGLELVIPNKPDPDALFRTRSVFVAWADYVPKPAPGGASATRPQVLPGMSLAAPIAIAGAPSTTPPRDAIRGFATLTFDAAPLEISKRFAPGQIVPTQSQLDPLVSPRLAIDTATNLLTWKGLQLNASEEQALAALAANPAFGANFRQQVHDLLTAIGVATPQFMTRSGFAEVLFPCQWPDDPAQPPDDPLSAASVFGSSAGRVDMGYTIRYGFADDKPWSHDLLLNGWIDVKNLVSWPLLQGNELQSVDAHFTFPAARSPGTALNHLRHTARVLLNQLAVADGKLQVGDSKSGEALLVVAGDFALQFLTVVEHKFVEVALAAGTRGAGNPPPPTISELSNERSWSVVQEVRLATPGVFAAFLRELATYTTPHLGFTSDLVSVPFANLSYQHEEIRALLAADLQALTGDPGKARRVLLVEASVPVCVNPDDWAPPASAPLEPFAPLQYLPMGTQRGIIATFNDFSSGRTPTSQWAYIGLPFLGRLQDVAGDGTKAVDLPGAGESRLRLDPILHLYAQALAGGGATALDTLPLFLASWADNAASTLEFRAFDVLPGQTWPRLDPATLEESWFRVLSGALDPPPAPVAKTSLATDPAPTAGSVLAALPSDSPGRLSRTDALAALVDPNRAFYPPSRPAAAPAATAPSKANFVWGQGALYVLQRLTNAVNRDPHGFALAGKRLFQLDRLVRKDATDKRRLPAVTLLPPPLEPGMTPPPSFLHPVSFAVSPYLGLDYRDESRSIPSPTPKPDALFGELLALDRTGVRMIVVATKLFVETVTTGSNGVKTVVEPSDADLTNWALETYRRLAADSPIAVLRRRAMLKSATGGLIIDYDFLPFRDSDRPSISKTPPQPIRAEQAQLRFAEGQRNRAAPPVRALAVELAPPQTRDVQPLRRVDEKPWGFSGVRLDVTVAAGAEGTVGYDDARLWWQICQHYVQFAPPIPDGVTPPLGGGPMAREAGRLPKMFRARAIRGLLPAVPDLVLPRVENLPELKSADQPLSLDNAVALNQAALPGSVRCTVIGGRAGVPFAFRPHLIVQNIPADAKPGDPTPSYNSGAVPVQHRMPRPVPLPPNHLVMASPETARPFPQNVALDTWGSWFDMGNPGDLPPAGELRTTIASAIPRDDAFYLRDLPDLRLIAWGNGSGVPTSGKTLMIAGVDNKNLLHVRIFDAFGKLVTDIDETKLAGTQSATISALKLGLPGLLPPHIVTNAEAAQIVAEVISILGQSLPDAAPIGLDVAWSNLQGVPPGLPSTATSITLRLTPEGDGTLMGWSLKAALVLSVGRFDLGGKVLAASDNPLALNLPPDAQKALGGLPHGDPARVEVVLACDNAFTIKGYHQTLPLASRVCQPDGPVLPLQPVYALFEDPDYSRSLATPTAHGGKTLRRDEANGGAVLVQLAADRREYNPSSPIFLACFTDDADSEAQTFGRLVVYRRFGRNVSEALTIEGPFTTPPGGQIDVSVGFNLNLLPPQPNLGGLPTAGTAVIILAEVQTVLHFRVFDATGDMIVDTDASAFPNRAESIKDLDAQYNQLLAAGTVTPQNQRSVITAVAAILNVLWIEGAPIAFAPPDIPHQASDPPLPPSVWINAGQIYRLHVESVLEPDDILEFQLDHVSIGQPAPPPIALKGDTIVVDVTITDRPVTPPPQAGFGLLRSDASEAAVSCMRFAWSPEASRIDLVNPDDLRTQIVRRRAVFRWTDVVRPPARNFSYAVQKLTAGGSTRAGLAKFETIGS